MANAIILPPLPIAAVTANTTALGAATNLTNDYAGVIWRSSPGNVASLVIDLGSDQFVDSVMLFGLTGSIPAGAYSGIATATAAQGPFTGSFWASAPGPVFAGSAPIAVGNGVLLWLLNDPARPPTCRYISVTVGDLGPGGFIQASRIVVGKALKLERNFSYGAAFGVRDLGSLDFNRRGVMQRTRGRKLRTVGLTFSNIRKDEVDSTTGPLLEAIGNTELFALVTDPAPDAQRQRRCYYGALVGDLGHTWRNVAAFEAKANLVSIF